MVEAEANDLYPSPELLSAFALGKLGEKQIAVVARHLSDCATCRDTATTSTDGFLDLLRPDQAAPAGPDVGPAEQDAPLVIPAPLRHHDRYRVIRSLGRGGMGSVYLAEHRLLKELRAIKVINPALIDNPRAVERFTRETGLLPRLHHPAVVQGFGGEEAAGLYLLVMEYIEGETLAQLVESQGPLPVALACDYARQVADGLQYAHEQGLVHRDIKPTNLMLTAAGQVKVLDFGLARLRSESRADAGLTHEHAAMGTPDYSAPEQALDARNADICADIYSLGCTLFYLLTGRPPFGNRSALAVSVAHLHDPPPALRDLRADAPAELCDLVGRMLAKLPSQRPQTPAEVAACLAQFIAQEGAKSKEQHTPTTSRSPMRPWRWAAVILVLVPSLALALWGAGILRVHTPDGVIVLERLPDGAEVFVDGRQIDLRLPGDKEKVRIEAPPGKRELKIIKGGFEAFTKEITLVSGRTESVKVSLKPSEELAKPPAVPEKGWESLFNGKDLTGWRTWDGSSGGWKVEGGAIVSQGPWRYLFSERSDLEDFHLRVEAWIDDGGRSGVRFRAPFPPHDPLAFEVPINATNIDGQRTGSLRDLVPVVEKPHEPGEWFVLEIIARGENLTTKVNGRTTASRKNPAFKKGKIVLLGNQGAGRVKFRRIDVRPLPVSRKPLAKGEDGEFVPLFNGKDLTNWAAALGGSDGWAVERGELTARGRVPVLYTDYGYFENFHLRVEAMINDGGTARVGFRAYRDIYRQRIPQGWYAVINALGPSPEKTGSLSDTARADKALHRPGEWVTLEVIMRGDHLVIRVNGQTTVDRREARFYMGHIVLHQELPDSEVRFRKIEIKELPAASPPRGFGLATPVKGVWSTDKDELVQTSREFGALLLFGETDLANYDFSFRAKAEEGKTGFKVFFHYAQPGFFNQFAVGNYGNQANDLSFEHGGRWGRKEGMVVPGKIEFGRWYDVRLEVREDKYRCILDGKTIFSCQDERFKRGRLGFSTWNSVARFRDLRLTTPEGRILLEGLPELPK